MGVIDMTGIERLREFAEGVLPTTAVCGITKTAYDREHMEVIGDRLHDFLAEIADQIEAEQEERITRRVEDREAAEWVRKHGGLEAVRDAHKTNVWALSLAINAHDALFGEDSERDTTPTEFKRELDRRLMPEGMEWPRFEDGVPVAFHDKGLDVHGHTRSVEGVKFTQGGFVFISDDMGNAWWANDCGPMEDPVIDRSKRVKRPAPKVLDADGAEIRVGETLYRIGNNDSVTVRQLMPPDKFEDTDFVLHFASEHTHRAPVLAADGKPLREGETVYLLHGDWCGVYPCYGYHGGEKIKVVELHTCHSSGGVRCENDTGFACYPQPSQLAHERPVADTWERLEEDAYKDDCEYFGRDMNGCEGCPASTQDLDNWCCDENKKARDLVRRAKALAERDA